MRKQNINWPLLIPLLVTTVVAVSGLVVGNRLNSERDLHNKRVELRTKYLLDAYRQLEASVDTEVSRQNLDTLQSAIADIQLLGSREQVVKLMAWSDQFYGKEHLKDVDLQDLLEDLRASLREELGLEPIAQKIRHVRFNLASEVEKTKQKPQ